MEPIIQTNRLDRPVDHTTDHVLGPTDAEIRPKIAVFAASMLSALAGIAMLWKSEVTANV